jgi:hypothetical protein
MNCKPGDLAVIIRTSPAWAKYLGRLVTCLELDPYHRQGPSWRLDIKHTTGAHIYACDSGLRPIRDNPGKDETLDWCPVPTKETA